MYKDDNKDFISISYRIKSFDSARFMVSSLSNFVYNLFKEIIIIF